MRILETERTVVDRITRDDAPFLCTLMNSPGWLRFIGNRGIANTADAREHIEARFLSACSEHGFGYYVVRTAAELAPAGVCGFLKKPTLDNPDFGYAFLPEFGGRGLAGEACRAVLDYGIRRFGFTALDAVVRPDNERSIRLLAKCGFREVGTIAGDSPDGPDLLFRWPAAPDSAGDAR